MNKYIAVFIIIQFFYTFVSSDCIKDDCVNGGCIRCNYDIRPVGPQILTYAYSPFWDHETQSLYYVDYVGVADPLGQLLTGTYRIRACPASSDQNGTVYLFQKNGNVMPLIPNMREVSGFAWNLKKNLMYYFDSCDYNIREYKWDPHTGLIGSDYRVVINFPPTEKYEPIGLTIACNGHLYVGVYSLLLSGTSLVLEIDPKKGIVVDYIVFPSETVTGVTFGGPDMDVLFVTTSASTYLPYFDLSLPTFVPSNNTQYSGKVYRVEGIECACRFKGCPRGQTRVFDYPNV